MHARLKLVMDEISTGFWFIPTLMLLLASVLALVLLQVDRSVDPGIKASIEWAYTGGADGARSLLSTIAGSMITAATVTFSLASVALSIASQQYGSRVLRNYMRDRITQFLLGTFVSTFIYAVLVVRSIRGSDEGGFVPEISVTVAIALSLISLVLLIFFVHHISASIRASRQLIVIARDLQHAMSDLYPSFTEQRQTVIRPTPTKYLDLVSEESGYLQSIDIDTLFEVAVRESLLIELRLKPGDHHIGGAAVAKVSGTDELSEHCRRELLSAFILGGERTPAQDIRFEFQQLAEIVVRALSPAINDPFIAENGIDQLASGLSRFARHPRVAQKRVDHHGNVRLIAPGPELSEILDETVGHIAIYASADRFVLARLVRVLDVVQPDLRTADELRIAAMLRNELQGRLGAALDPSSGSQAA